MSSGSRQVLSYHESLLRESDVNLLRGPHWLNDQIISFYFEYLEKEVFKEATEFLFVSPEVTQCLKIVSSDEVSVFLSPLNATEKDVIFFALNNNDNTTAGGSHWSLLVLSRQENTFFHFDSSSGSNLASSRRFFNHLKRPLNCPTAELIEQNCLQQSNCYDCGIHLICVAERVAQHFLTAGSVCQTPDTAKEQVSRKRRDILDIIRQLGGEI
ncbi:sentrin-specific protease 8 [Phlebotomus argentipes]|uniref:sentrin-specific protease 8 n=1 Tax=Phlebotomus argentipes TaxID=94469 RepID=UPI00289318D3|nr:sentrin-specific protease 8 [Phlebotomus argentipes]